MMSPEAKKLAEENMAFAKHLAVKYARNNSEVDDFFGLAMYGLCKAANTFDASKGFRFSTYSARVMSNEIIMGMRRSKRHEDLPSIDDTLEGGGELGDIIGEEDTKFHDLEHKNLIDFALHTYETKKRNKRYKNHIRDLEITKRVVMDNVDQVRLCKEYGISQSYVSRIVKGCLSELKGIIVKSGAV